MHSMITSSRRPWLFAFFALLLVGGLVSAACAGDDDDDTNGNGGGADTAAMINAITFLDGAGLHGIDDSINVENTIPGNARTVALKAETVTRLTAWPEELQSSADALAQIFAEMAAAVDGDDLAAAGQAAMRAHDAEHDFSHDVWAHLYSEAGIESGGEGGH